MSRRRQPKISRLATLRRRIKVCLDDEILIVLVPWAVVACLLLANFPTWAAGLIAFAILVVTVEYLRSRNFKYVQVPVNCPACGDLIENLPDRDIFRCTSCGTKLTDIGDGKLYALKGRACRRSIASLSTTQGIIWRGATLHGFRLVDDVMVVFFFGNELDLRFDEMYGTDTWMDTLVHPEVWIDVAGLVLVLPSSNQFADELNTQALCIEQCFLRYSGKGQAQVVRVVPADPGWPENEAGLMELLTDESDSLGTDLARRLAEARATEPDAEDA